MFVLASSLLGEGGRELVGEGPRCSRRARRRVKGTWVVSSVRGALRVVGEQAVTFQQHVVAAFRLAPVRVRSERRVSFSSSSHVVGEGRDDQGGVGRRFRATFWPARGAARRVQHRSRGLHFFFGARRRRVCERMAGARCLWSAVSFRGL